MIKKLFTLIITFCIVFTNNSNAQQATAEDSLNKFQSLISNTWIGGYGNAFYQRDFNLQEATVNLERVVLFVGYKFNKKISFFSEIEFEDAKTAGGEEGGEVALEQAYLKFSLNPDNYLIAGLFIPRLGILNENHLPNTYNGNERNPVERLIIPSTWRELGVGYYGTSPRYFLNWTVGVMNGLNSAGFEHGTGIRGGRYEGQNASANNLAATASLQFHRNNLKIQASGYAGGTVGLSPRQADSLRLTSGMFGTPAILTEANIQYERKGFSLKLLGAMISIPDAADINLAYANNTPESAYGMYAELGYDLFRFCKKKTEKQMILFARYENFNLNAAIPDNGIEDETLNQQHIVAGFSYLPLSNVIVKADIRLVHTGKENPQLVINPNPAALPYRQDNAFFNLGIGYSF